MGKTLTWWVSYSYTYKLFMDDEWSDEEDFDAGRFTCLKKDIKEHVRKEVESQFCPGEIKDLEVTITDCYQTTEYEI
jgi:hypothetical protein